MFLAYSTIEKVIFFMENCLFNLILFRKNLILIILIIVKRLLNW